MSALGTRLLGGSPSVARRQITVHSAARLAPLPKSVPGSAQPSRWQELAVTVTGRQERRRAGRRRRRRISVGALISGRGRWVSGF